MKSLSPKELAQALVDGPKGLVVLDVRETTEVAWCQIAGSLHIPMGEIPSRVGELDQTQKIVVLCHHGMRSAAIVDYLESRGFENVYNLKGGIDAWSVEVDPDLRRY